jgi:TonB family protein
MKIVCDACGAKYAIADEKVRGKVFKIRCKKCSNVIVVRGLSGEGDAADEQLSQQETRTFGYDEQEGAEAASSEGVWHLVIDQDQIGPITDEEVRERFARGEVDRDTYAWREGFGDWMPLAAIDVFADLGSGHASGRVAGASAGSAESPAADPFSAADSGGDGGGDLFGGANAGDGLFGDNGAGSAADRRLRGERNENSVLFSLGNLAALASDAPKVAAPSSAMGAAPAGRAQAGGSEGSGLIDIRSMAQSYLGGKDRGGAAVPMSSFGPVEPVSFSTQSPVLLPQTPVSGGGSNKTLIAAIIGGSAAVVVAVVVVLIIVLRSGDGPTVANGTPGAVTDPTGEAANPDTPPGTSTPDPTAAGGGTAKPSGTVPGTVVTPPPDQQAADIAGRKPDEGTGKNPRTPTSGRTEREPGSSRTPSGSRDPDKTEKPADKPTPTPPAGGGGCLDEVGCLLADKPPACCSKYSGGGGGSKKPGGGSGGDSNLPEKLTRSDITAGINKVRSGVTGCSSKGSGEVKVTVKVEGSGSVGDVSVKSAPNAALGTCVANAVKKAKFAKTQEGATFTYPFVF